MRIDLFASSLSKEKVVGGRVIGRERVTENEKEKEKERALEGDDKNVGCGSAIMWLL